MGHEETQLGTRVRVHLQGSLLQAVNVGSGVRQFRWKLLRPPAPTSRGVPAKPQSSNPEHGSNWPSGAVGSTLGARRPARELVDAHGRAGPAGLVGTPPRRPSVH